MAGKLNPAFAAAIARRNSGNKSSGKSNPFSKKGPQDLDAGPNDPPGPMDAQDMKMGKGSKAPSKGGTLPQFLKK